MGLLEAQQLLAHFGYYPLFQGIFGKQTLHSIFTQRFVDLGFGDALADYLSPLGTVNLDGAAAAVGYDHQSPHFRQVFAAVLKLLAAEEFTQFAIMQKEAPLVGVGSNLPRHDPTVVFKLWEFLFWRQSDQVFQVGQRLVAGAKAINSGAHGIGHGIFEVFMRGKS